MAKTNVRGIRIHDELWERSKSTLIDGGKFLNRTEAVRAGLVLLCEKEEMRKKIGLFSRVRKC